MMPDKPRANPKKSLGQNFLINPGVAERIAKESVSLQPCGVLEIGSGLGALTCQLAPLCQKLVAVEIDGELTQGLEHSLMQKGIKNVEMVHGDALKLDLRTLIAKKFEGLPVVVSANLPYYATSPILTRLLEEELGLQTITVMVQKEAGVRFCAELKTREVGAISFLVRFYTEPRFLFSVSRGSFNPVPNVDSAVVRFAFHKRQPVDERDKALFFGLVRKSFEQRRKTILNSLAGFIRLF